MAYVEKGLPPIARFHSLSPSSPPPITGSTTSSLVSTTVSILRSHHSRTRWNFLRSVLPKTATISPSEAFDIIICLRNNPRLALRFFLWSRDRSLCHHDLSSYSAIVHTLARSRLRSTALSLLRAALRSHPDSTHTSILRTLTLTYHTCNSAPFVFDLLIQAYLHSRNLDSALYVARSYGVRPLASTSNSLLRVAAKLRGSTAALNLYHELFADVRAFRPNLQTFNALLLALYRDGRAEMNGEILAEMERFGCEQNAFTYSVLMAGFCENREVEEAWRLWKEMEEKGIEPDVTTYNTLISGFCDAGEVGRAEELYQEMVMRDMEPTGTTFESLMKGHCQAGDVEAAMLVFGDMRRRGLRLSVEIFDEMLHKMSVKGWFEECLSMLRNEMGRGGFLPSRKSYEVIIKGLCSAGKMEEAMKLQAEMSGRGFEADVEVYGAFICGYEKMGEAEMVKSLRRELLQLPVVQSRA